MDNPNISTLCDVPLIGRQAVTREESRFNDNVHRFALPLTNQEISGVTVAPTTRSEQTITTGGASKGGRQRMGTLSVRAIINRDHDLQLISVPTTSRSQPHHRPHPSHLLLSLNLPPLYPLIPNSQSRRAVSQIEQ